MKETKDCKKCGKAFPLEKMYRHKIKNKDGSFRWYYGGICKICNCEKAKQHYRKNQEKAKERSKLAYHRKKKEQLTNKN